MNDDITFYAFRYALGRKTYAVQTVVEYILENWELLKPATRGLIQAEIEMAIDKGEAGMEMDVKQWTRLLN